MSTMSEKARDAAKSKAERMVRTDPSQRVDASGYRPDGPMDANAQTGMRVLSRRQFRRGGKVAGEASAPRADRKPRKSGGSTLTADDLINRDLKDANRERAGVKHVGGFKNGGRPGKLAGGGLTPQQRMAVAPRAPVPAAAARPMVGRPVMRKAGGKVHADEAQDRKLIHDMGCKCAKCGGGRVGRKDGGGNWIADAVKHPGSLHKSLHVPAGKDIPQKKLSKAANSDNPKLAKKAHLAETLKHLPHKKDGGAINDGTRPVAGRLARKSGGRAKKGTNVNIIITQPSAARAPMPMPVQAGPPGLRQGMPPGAPPTMPPAMPPGAAAAPPPGLMPRASGGRTLEKDGGKPAKAGSYPIETGAGGGLARLEKAERAERR